MAKSIFLTSLVLALIAIVSTASGSTGSSSGALRLVSGDGAAPRYVPVPAETYRFRYRPGVKGLFQLRWGEGGPPVLVPLGPTE